MKYRNKSASEPQIEANDQGFETTIIIFFIKRDGESTWQYKRILQIN